ncbi:MAG: hypothetical protein IJX50_00270 [Clostridia bacterium]|nr:hypothetical protein [Clostridia bacterium]
MTGNSMELNIQLFAEGGSGEGSGVSAAVAQPQTSGDGGVSATSSPAAGEKKNSGFGVQNAEGDSSAKTGDHAGFTPTDDSGVGNAGSSEEAALDLFFEKHPELKKVNDKRNDMKTQKAIQKRLYQESKSQKPINDILDKLMVLHGAKNVEELSVKLNKTLPQEFAVNRGLDGEVGEEMFNLQFEKMQENRMREYYEKQAKVERQMQAWRNEAKEIMAIYPEFNLEDELQNPDFARLISATDERYRMPMKQIYEMLHHDDLMKAAEKRAAEAYSKSVNANKQRPNENGTGNQNAVSGAFNVSKLSKKDRADLAKRAGRGEIITL